MRERHIALRKVSPRRREAPLRRSETPLLRRRRAHVIRIRTRRETSGWGCNVRVYGVVRGGVAELVVLVVVPVVEVGLGLGGVVAVGELGLVEGFLGGEGGVWLFCVGGGFGLFTFLDEPEGDKADEEHDDDG